MIRLLIVLLLAGSVLAADSADAALAQRDTALATSAKRFATTPATWLVTLRQGAGDPTLIETWSRTAGEWRQVRTIRRQGKSQAEVRSLGDITWIKAGSAVVEVRDVALRQRLAAIEGTAWFLPRAFDPAVVLAEPGAWRGRPAIILTGNAPAGHSGPVHGIRWIITKDDGVIVQVDRFGKDGAVLWSAIVERCERLVKIEDAMFTGFTDATAKRGVTVPDLTADLLAPCEP